MPSLRNNDYRAIKVPFRLEKHHFSRCPRITDGLSNQILIGEKYLSSENMNACPGNNSNLSSQYMVGDCNIYMFGAMNELGTYTAARSPFAGIAKGPEPPPEGGGKLVHEDSHGQWGGSHPGVVLFLLGDGSVRVFPNTIPTAGDSTLAYLGVVDDGNPVQLP